MIPFNLGSKPVQQTCLNVALPERIEPALGSSVPGALPYWASTRSRAVDR